MKNPSMTVLQQNLTNLILKDYAIKNVFQNYFDLVKITPLHFVKTKWKIIVQKISPRKWLKTTALIPKKNLNQDAKKPVMFCNILEIRWPT